ncbi:hypothetical protein CRENBAI_009125 [Crenichthys baileyi]|uniref:Uncharacterized protein n=1 Tax=Crenichthys baileyi TaxID=28760 RepID=A0AAV9QTY4_9TELE
MESQPSGIGIFIMQLRSSSSPNLPSPPSLSLPLSRALSLPHSLSISCAAAFTALVASHTSSSLLRVRTSAALSAAHSVAVRLADLPDWSRGEVEKALSVAELKQFERSGRRGLHLRPLPNPLCTGPSWFPLQVVGPLGDGLESLIRAWHGRVLRGATQPPGRPPRQVPTPGLAPGWDPGSAVPGDITCHCVVLKKVS